MRKIKLLIVLSICIVKLYSQDTIRLYSEDIIISKSKTILINPNVKCNENSIQLFISHLEDTRYKKLVKELLEVKERYNLNDWLYYKLIDKLISTIASEKDSNCRTILNGFLLAKSGYNIQFLYGDRIELFVPSQDIVYIPKIKYRGIEYYCLSNMSLSDSKKEAKLKISKALQNEKGKMFSFYMITLPYFINSKYIEKTILFRKDTFLVTINNTIINIFNDYPILDTKFYYSIPLSDSAYLTLVENIRSKTNGLNEIDAIRYILSFVRLQNEYGSDDESFDKDKPMIPEEALFYESSDCEDRSVLFYYLVHEIVDKEMIVLKYPNHINIAVKLENFEGMSINYKRGKYYVCEPSNVLDNKDIGYSECFSRGKPKIIDPKDASN